MLFNLAEFIFGFPPVTLAVSCFQRSRLPALGWLTLASLFTPGGGCWTLIIAPRSPSNYGLARL